MGKIERNKELKRRAILNAARGVFLTEGYVLASMDTIAANARVTKQTVYRYFQSKEDLFQATLLAMGEASGESFLEQLNKPDPEEALHGFAVAFIHAHLSEEHLATIRLLIAEHAKAPELKGSFHSIGPDETDRQLAAFFREMFQMKETSHPVRMWTSMLLALRMGVLMGLPHPTDSDIEDHAKKTTRFFLTAIS